jgi:NADH:ubiquinone oxidoreductase subunit E
MSHSDYHQYLELSFEGHFLGFEGRVGKLKYLRLRVLSEEMQVKIPKEMRMSIGLWLHPGELIRVSGRGKFDRHTQELKLKVNQITPLAERCDLPLATRTTMPLPPTGSLPDLQPQTKPKVKILVCQKSGCLKKGSKGLGKALEQILRDRNLNHQVIIQPTGCLKKCSSAPNLLLTPGKTCYTKVRLETLPQIAETISESLQSNRHKNQ